MPTFSSRLTAQKGQAHKEYRASVLIGGKEAGHASLAQYPDEVNTWIMEAYAVGKEYQGLGLSYALSLIMLREIHKRNGRKAIVFGAHGNMIKVFTNLGFTESNRAYDPSSKQEQARFDTTNIVTALQQCQVIVGQKDLDESTSGSGGCCYITTAVCGSLGLPDDCDELVALRRFRDSVLFKSTSGTQDVLQYYSVAPAIVDAIDARSDASAIYADLYKRYIGPAVAALDAGDHVLPHTLFRDMTAETRRAYLPAAEE